MIFWLIVDEGSYRDREVNVGDRWEDLTDHVSKRIGDHIQPYIDMHYVYALAKAGKEEKVWCSDDMSETDI